MSFVFAEINSYLRAMLAVLTTVDTTDLLAALRTYDSMSAMLTDNASNATDGVQAGQSITELA